MKDNLVTYEVDGAIARIGLNRLAKRNALDADLREQLVDAVRRAHREVRAGVLFSHGDHFCAGLDLKEATGWMTDHQRHADLRIANADVGRPHDYLARGGIPFVAAINGACIGGGLELAAACHLRVGDDTAFFALPEGQRGIYIGGGGSVRVARLLGVGRMTDLMLTGRVLDAAEGERFGVLQYRVDAGRHIEHAVSLARRIADNAPLTNWAVVHGLPRIQDMAHDDGLFVEGLLGHIAASPESVTRIDKFVAGKAPRLGDPGQSGNMSANPAGQQD